MTVQELIAVFEEFPPDHVIVMAARPAAPAGDAHIVVGAHVRNFLPSTTAPKTRGVLLDHNEDPDQYPTTIPVVAMQPRGRR